MGNPANSSENSSTEGGIPESRIVTRLSGWTSLINRHSPGVFFATKKYRDLYGPCEYSRTPDASFCLTCSVTASWVDFGRRRFCCCHGMCGTVGITTGGSIEG